MKNPHLTHGCAPELERCIAQTAPGQAGWAGWYSPAPGEICGSCANFEPSRKQLFQEQMGTCAKYHGLKGRRGAKFEAFRLSCRYYEKSKKK